VPPGGFGESDGSERRVDDRDAGRGGDFAGEAPGDGRDQVGAGDQEGQGEPAGGGHHHVGGDALLGEGGGGRVGLAVREAGGGVRCRGEVGEREPAAVQPRIGGVGDVHEPVPPDHLLLAGCLQPRRREQQVATEQPPVALQHRRGDGPCLEPYPGRQFPHPRQQPAQRQGGLPADRDQEPARAGRRVELLRRAQRSFDLVQGFAHGGQQVPGHRGEPVFPPGPDEEFVSEVLPQPRKRAAHRRLAQAELRPGPRHVPLAEQRVELHEHVQVDAASGAHRSPFPLH
jgi:hypothetical protein